MRVNPYQDTPERQERRRQVAFVAGLLLALGGSYVAITEAFGDHIVCGPLGCIDTRDPTGIWLGVVAVVAGVVLMVRNYRRRTERS